MPKKQGAKRLPNGDYLYKGFILKNYGYYPPDRQVWWEAVNPNNDCGDYHAATKKELMALIDEDEQ